MVSISFMLFIHAHDDDDDLSHPLCYSTLFSGGLFISVPFCLFFFTLTNIYFDSLIRFIPPSGFLISGSKREVH